MKRLSSITNILFLALFVVACNPKINKNMSEEEKKAEMNNEESDPKAIEHNAPDQAKIDSIKAAKAKLRGNAKPAGEEGGK